MDNIFSKGDKFIHFRKDGSVDTGIVKNVSISQVSDHNGFCYEVINLITENGVLSLGQTSGQIFKLNHTMTKKEIKDFAKNKYRNPFPTKYE